MSSTGSSGGKMGQWWERQKDNTKSLVKKVSKGRLSNSGIGEDTDKSGVAEDAAEEEQPLRDSAAVTKTEPQAETSSAKKMQDKVTSLFDDDSGDEAGASQATASQPSRAPKFSYTS